MPLMTKSSPVVLACQFSTTSDSGSDTGKDRSKIASMKLKIAVLAPMPSARDETASKVNRRFVAMVRNA